MSSIYKNPAEFTEDATAGFVDLHSARLRQVTGGVVRRVRRSDPVKVAIVVGGGSGHYPAFAGLVGPGFADGAVIGNLFTSPSTAQAYTVARAAERGRGAIFTYGNYAGDVMNFGLAGERLQAEEGLGIDQVEELGRRANAATFTLGVAFSGCRFPGADKPHFTVPDGKLGLGLGIHGEPGLEDIDWMPADELAELLVSRLLPTRPDGHPGRVAVVVNGLGRTKYEELFLLYGEIAPKLRQAGLEIVAPEVGELVTSLDMGGVSLTITWLDEELERLWLATADTPAWTRRPSERSGEDTLPVDEVAEEAAVPVVASERSRVVAQLCLQALEHTVAVLEEHERHLGEIDAIAGDGDHGRGMVRGSRSALEQARVSLAAGWGAAGVLTAAGDAWAEHAGGTSGVLWGAGIRAFGTVFGNESGVDAKTLVAAVDAFRDAVTGLGKAEIGDKTLVDALIPFADEFARQVDSQQALAVAGREATATSQQAAEATAGLRPRKGRARPLAERSIGTPDPGAISFALIARSVVDGLSGADN